MKPKHYVILLVSILFAVLAIHHSVASYYVADDNMNFFENDVYNVSDFNGSHFYKSGVELITAIDEDTTPSLSGNLDANDYNITAINHLSAEIVNELYFVDPGNASDIQAKIDLCAGSCKVIIPNGTYTLTEPIRLNRTGITLVGAGMTATLLEIPDNETGIIIGDQNVGYNTACAVRDLKINPINACTSGSQKGIYINYSKFNDITRVDVTGICGTGIELNNWARHNRIHDNNIDVNYGPALYIHADVEGPSNNNNILNNQFQSQNGSGAILDHTGWTVDSNVFVGNQFYSANDHVVVVGKNTSADIYHNLFTGNLLNYGSASTVNNTYSGFVLNGSDQGAFVGNVVFGHSSSLFLKYGVLSDSTSEANTFSGNKFYRIETKYSIDSGGQDNFLDEFRVDDLYVDNIQNGFTIPSGNINVDSGTIYSSGDIYGQSLLLNYTNAGKIYTYGDLQHQYVFRNSTGSNEFGIIYSSSAQRFYFYDWINGEKKFEIDISGDVSIMHSNLDIEGNSIINILDVNGTNIYQNGSLCLDIADLPLTNEVLSSAENISSGTFGSGNYIFPDNLTASWFFGYINWSNIQNKFIAAVDDEFIYMSGTTATFNKSLMNDTINIIVISANTSQTTYADATFITLANPSLSGNLDANGYNITNTTYLNATDADITTISGTTATYSGIVSGSAFEGNLNWTDLMSYPTTCPANTYITTLGDNSTCESVNTFPSGAILTTGNMDILAGGLTMTGNIVASTLTLNTSSNGKIITRGVNEHQYIFQNDSSVPQFGMIYQVGAQNFFFYDWINGQVKFEVNIGGDVEVKNSNLSIESGDYLCLDGNTCSAYIYYNGSCIVSSNGGCI